MARGSGAGGCRRAAGQVTAAITGMGEGGVSRVSTVLGVEQQVQSLQLGGHSPPDSSVGQCSVQAGSPNSAPSPLVWNERTSTTAARSARNTPEVYHRGIGPAPGSVGPFTR